MLMTTRQHLLLILIMFLAGYAPAQEVRFESITYLEEDGRSYTNYANLKSGYLTIYTYIPKDETPQEYYQYLYPNDYEWQKIGNKDFDKINFLGGDYAMVLKGKYEEDVLTVDENGVFTYHIAETKVNDHYGLFWESPNNSGFTEFSYVWILPEEYEILSYSANREGEWVERSNSLSFFAKNTNDVVIEIRYQKRKSTPQQLSAREVKVVDSLRLTEVETTLKVRDNGLEDGDIISLNLNGEWIMKGLKVKKQEITLSLPLRKGNNYLIMYAENEGSIPPNTAMMEIGGKRLMLNSTAETSEGIEIFVE